MQVQRLQQNKTFGTEFSPKLMEDVRREYHACPSCKTRLHAAANNILRLKGQNTLDYQYNKRTGVNDWVLIEKGQPKNLQKSFSGECDMFEIEAIAYDLRLKELQQTYDELYREAYPVKSFFKRLNPFNK